MPNMQATPKSPTAQFEIREVGRVLAVRKFIVIATGLDSAINGQIVQFEKGMKGIVMGFKDDKIQILVLGSAASIRNGDEVFNRGETLLLPVGERFITRIVNSLCEPLDDGGPIPPNDLYPVFRDAPGIMDRVPVEKTLETGTLCVDAGIPIALGQRQLLIGDRLTGKTTVAVDAVLNQKKTGVICIYCCIGKPYVSLVKLLELLEEKEALTYSIVVSAVSSTSVGEQYLAPYTACMLGEYFMNNGRDVLVIFDDLTKHAWVYRQISLLLDRAPGREAYPGDIFYIHSQLVERAGYLKPELKGGSMTFLPIVEILQGDVTGYISTNLISMTDGQIYFNTSLFNKGIRPSVDFGLSVSRIGSKAQWAAMREVSKSLRIDYLQYQELLQMSQIRASGLSKEAEARLKRGAAMTQILIQNKNRPFSIDHQILILSALNKGFLDGLPPEQISEFKEKIYSFVSELDPELLLEMKKTKSLTAELKERLIGRVQKYFQGPNFQGRKGK